MLEYCQELADRRRYQVGRIHCGETTTGSAMGKSPEELTCISIIICDDIYRDERTKKLVIIGTFNRILTPSFPCVHPKLTVLFSITNGNGEYDLKVSVEHERTGARLVELGGACKIDNPLAITDINLSLEGITFQEPGKYWLTIAADGETLQQRPFFVERASQVGTGRSENDAK